LSRAAAVWPPVNQPATFLYFVSDSKAPVAGGGTAAGDDCGLQLVGSAPRSDAAVPAKVLPAIERGGLPRLDHRCHGLSQKRGGIRSG
jgi:hypothetical protein